jgi:hypothetical protein
MTGREEMTELYAEHEATVYGIAINFARRHHRETDEIIARANLIFACLFHDHDPAKGDFAIRLRYLLPKRLLETLRTDNSVIRYDTRCAASGQFCFVSSEILKGLPMPDLYEEFDYDGVAKQVDADARQVLGLVREMPPEIRERPSKNRLRLYLRVRGWENRRVSRAFRELRKVVMV